MAFRVDSGYCDRHYDRITPEVISHIHDAAYELGLVNARDIDLLFVDGDETYKHYSDGFHEWGKLKSLILVRVWPEDYMPQEYIIWMACHELRHAYQSIHNMFEEAEYGDAHDDLPSEMDANQWANEFTGLDGVAWWETFVKSV